MRELLNQIHASLWFEKGLRLGSDIGLGLLLLVLGVWISRRLANIFRRSLERAQVEPLLSGFLSNLVHGILSVLLLVAALDVAGLPTASLLAALGAAGLAIGLALQGSLSNIASGVLLILFRPFHVGDQIEVLGHLGIVERIGLMHTVLITPDNRVLTIPNARLAADTIINNTARDQRRIDLQIQLAYRDQIELAMQIIRTSIAKQADVLTTPECELLVINLAETGVTIAIRPWVKTADYNNVKSNLLMQIKLDLEAAGITMPLPQRELRIRHQEELR